MNISAYITLLRPYQWLKNLLLLFPPFFAGRIVDAPVLTRIPLALITFSLMASCGYLLNDVIDVDVDKNHEAKRRRAVASGAVPVSHALVLSLTFFVATLFLSFSVSRSYWIYLIAYFSLSLSYTFFFKNIVILDVVIIALGFLVRVLAGGEAFGITVTNWLFLTVFMVSLLLAAGKRLGEMVFLGGEAQNHRRSLNDYSHSFLEGALWFASSSALVMYALYSLEHRNKMFYTVPIVAFGLLRYIYIVKEGKGDPTDALLKDRTIMTVGILWAGVIGFIVYG